MDNHQTMKADDYDAVVGIDQKILKAPRPEYYNVKFEKLFQTKDYLPASLSLVAEEEDGTVVGFVIGGNLYGRIRYLPGRGIPGYHRR